jgi:hypothetical protein
MSTLVEIADAARKLTPDERRQLLLQLAESLRAEHQPLPPPRKFSREEMQAWMDEDEADMKRFREGK